MKTYMLPMFLFFASLVSHASQNEPLIVNDNSLIRTFDKFNNDCNQYRSAKLGFYEHNPEDILSFQYKNTIVTCSHKDKEVNFRNLMGSRIQNLKPPVSSLFWVDENGESNYSDAKRNMFSEKDSITLLVPSGLKIEALKGMLKISEHIYFLATEYGLRVELKGKNLISEIVNDDESINSMISLLTEFAESANNLVTYSFYDSVKRVTHTVKYIELDIKESRNSYNYCNTGSKLSYISEGRFGLPQEVNTVSGFNFHVKTFGGLTEMFDSNCDYYQKLRAQ